MARKISIYQRNFRLTVRRVIELLATYPDRAELRQEFPELEDEDIQQALIFASSYITVEPSRIRVRWLPLVTDV